MNLLFLIFDLPLPNRESTGEITLERFKLHWEIQKADEGKIVRDFVKEHEISRTALTDIKFKGGKITVNGEEVTVRIPLKAGDQLCVEFPEEIKSDGMLGEKIPLEILYEDPYIFVVNKPAGMSTIPSREHPTGSLANAILGYYEQLDFKSTVHIVTRLDRDTSGIVLIAKHRHIHHLFSLQQRNGAVDRTYEALAEGLFKEQNGTIEKPIRRNPDSIIEREVHQEGQFARTHYVVLKQYPSFAHVRLRLETGRTHQIRVHLSHIGHPLLGDDLYGGSLHCIKRQALHCSNLSFLHPVLKTTLQIETPLPNDFLQLLINSR